MTQYAYPAPREGWDRYTNGAKRGQYRVTANYDGSWRAFRMHTDLTSTNLGVFYSLASAQDFIERHERTQAA